MHLFCVPCVVTGARRGKVDREVVSSRLTFDLSPFHSFTMFPTPPSPAPHPVRPDVQTSFAVLVKVLDLNDNPPAFTRPTYNASVNELAAVGSVVFDRLEAHDPDSGQNALVEYFAVPGDAGQVSSRRLCVCS